MSLTVHNRARTKDAVYWAPDSKADKNGQPTYSEAPIQTKVKWTDTTMRTQGPQDSNETYSVMVLTGFEMAKDGYLMLGTLADVTDQTIPKNNEGARRIIRTTVHTTHSGDQDIYHAYL